MALTITEDCINCGACEPECPNTAIYEGGAEWRWGEGNDLKEITDNEGKIIDATTQQLPVAEDIYYIVSGKCTECIGFHETPQCAAVCPVDCCVDDPDNLESEEALLNKKTLLHLN